METLLQEIRSCAICANSLPHGVRPVVQAHTKARIMVIGQAPGRRVHESGIPFDDPSGDRLRRWLSVDKEIFYDPEQIAIVPMGFCFPGTGKSGDLPPRKECAPLWHQRLLASLPNIELTLLIGQFAQKYYLPKNSRSNLTDTVRHWEEHLPYLPLVHPSPRNQIWHKKNPWFEEEVVPALQKRVKKILEK